MAGIRVEGSVSGNVAEVDSSNQLKVMPGQATTPANVGAVRAFSEVDAGTITGTALLRSPSVSVNRRTRVGMDTVLFDDSFNAVAQNTNLWQYIFTTLTMSQPGTGFLQVGTVQGTTSSHGAHLRTFQYFPLFSERGLQVDISFALGTATLVANEEWRMGLGSSVTANVAPTDGIYFYLTTAGMRGAVIYNAVETQTAAFKTLASYTLETVFRLSIIVHRNRVEFWQDDVLMAALAIPAGNGQPFLQGSLPVFLQKMLTGNVTNTNVIRVSNVTVALLDSAGTKSWEAQLSGSGRSGTVGQNGQTQGQTAIYANSTAPTAVALTNTTAAFTGLGGQAAVLPTLAVSSDGIIYSFQNPAPTINLTGRNLLIYGVTLDSFVSVVFVGGPIAYQYFLAYGHTAVSLATAETGSFATATTHSPRRVPIGVQVYPATAAVTVTAARVGADFTSPLVVRPGEFIAVCAKAGVGSTVTSSGAVTFMVGFDAVWE